MEDELVIVLVPVAFNFFLAAPERHKVNGCGAVSILLRYHGLVFVAWLAHLMGQTNDKVLVELTCEKEQDYIVL